MSNIDAIICLDKKLSTLVRLKAFDDDKEPESFRIAYGIFDIKSALESILTIHNDKIEFDMDDLYEIQFHLQHIKWHIDSMKFIEGQL